MAFFAVTLSVYLIDDSFLKERSQGNIDVWSIAISSWDRGWLRQWKGAASLPRFWAAFPALGEGRDVRRLVVSQDAVVKDLRIQD
jgi:hypothetical protein